MKKTLLSESLAILCLLVSLLLFTFAMPDIAKVGSVDFDLVKWLDADIFILKCSFYFLISGFFFSLIALILGCRSEKSV